MKAFLLLALILSAVAQAGEITHAVIGNGDWPPYQSETLPGYGPASRIVSEAFALSGIEVQYSFIPWSRSLRDTANGQIDGTMVWRDIPGRSDIYHVSAPLFTSEVVFFFARERGWSELADLADLRIGAVTTYHYCPEFDAMSASGRLKLIRSATDEINLSMLAAGRLDAVITDRKVGLWEQAHLPQGAGRIILNPQPVCLTPMHLLLSRKTEHADEIARRFDQGLEKLRASRRLDQILSEIQ